MPNELAKIEEFQGGINSSSDPRDLRPSECTNAIDLMVDKLGTVRTMGSSVLHDKDGTTTPNQALTGLAPGYGLFQFSHDRRNAHDHGTWTYENLAADDGGANQLEDGDDYLALADAGGDSGIDIYSKRDNTWGAQLIELGGDTMTKPVFYYADGALRISDGNLDGQTFTMWIGYISRTFFGDTVTGYEGWNDLITSSNGLTVSKWHVTEAAPKALTVKQFIGDNGTFIEPDDTDPITIRLRGDDSLEHDDTWGEAVGDDEGTSNSRKIREGITLIRATITFAEGGIPTIRAGSYNRTPGFATFCNVGDIINVYADITNDGRYEVTKVSEGSDHEIEVKQDFANKNDDLQQAVWITNLSRSGEWFDPDNPGWECAVSTLYDESKQESALSKATGIVYPEDILIAGRGYEKVQITAHVSAGNGSTTGIPVLYPRVSGFRMYMRKENTSTWYLQSEIDISKGMKWFERGDYEMWVADDGDGDRSADVGGEALSEPRLVDTYEMMSRHDASSFSVGFDGATTGFKTAVVANKMAYVGHVRIKDWRGNIRTYGDTILKSAIGKYDSFSYGRRLEAEIQDGDNIVKLEKYADRLLVFKKYKMHIINISQETEFLEETHSYKGVSHHGATCATDSGIAWVNKYGCYLYDGEKVRNLLEDEELGRQKIDQDLWGNFLSVRGIIGYLPKKRQLIVLNDCQYKKAQVPEDPDTPGSGHIYCFDMITQSWTYGKSKLSGGIQSNFATDWDGDLIYCHPTTPTNVFADVTGAIVKKWDSTSVGTSNFKYITKDIDFGQPAQRKKIFKVYITYTGGASQNINVQYATNGSGIWQEFNGDLLDTTGDQVEAELKPSTLISNIKSIQLKFFGTAAATFKINDISIVHRLKYIR